MNRESTPSVQRHTRFADFNLAERQAVEDLRVAVRRRRALEREDLRDKSVAYRSDHARKRCHAVQAHAAARLALDELLAEDA